MSCLSWNCRGLGNPRTVRELHCLVKTKVPNFVFLMETKCKRSKVEKIKRLLNMEYSFVVDCKGLSGGLAFLWKEDVDAVLVSYSRQHISLEVKDLIKGKTWFLTGFYGNPITANRKGSWHLLRKLKPENGVGWLCVGDFNEILSTNEKVGGPLRPYGQMECFREALEDCDLSDMGYVGNKFTWSNNRGGTEFTKERLDRAFCNPQWAIIVLFSSPIEIINKVQEDIPKFSDMRRKVNKICKLIDDRDQEVTNASAICQQFQAFFQELFTTANPQNIDGCLAATIPTVTNEMNQALLRPYCALEVKEALFQMDGLSSPGPDGFPAAFYQQNWDVVGSQVSESVLYVLNSKGNLDDINNTFITLIPKKKNCTKVSDFRPISLCNVLYKIISKTIANMLKKILPSIISQNQSAFIPGRLLSDNVIVAFETLHSMHCKMASREGYMAMKLDMSKAYDRVEWSFLRAALCKMGFDFAWVELVMRCVESVSYSILVNGIPQSVFSPSRGIRRGDPLSPYLFIMCAEALGSMISKGVEEGVISGVPFARGRIRISHLFFADDSLLFCKANAMEWGKLHNILKIYEDASGQRLNLEKTSIQFSRNTAKATQDFILSIAGVRSSMAYEKYLGLPTIVGKAREKSFRDILDRVRMRVSNQRVKFLSQAGKDIFIKAIVQALPTYSMSVFMLPAKLLRNLNSIMHNFWWGQHEAIRKIHWVAWSKMGRSKADGGLGFRDLEGFNLALLAKQGWRVIHTPFSLVSQVLKAKYFQETSFMNAKLGQKPSYIWRSMLKARNLIDAGSYWRIGSGDKVRIWGDKWLPKTFPSAVKSPISHLDGNAKVQELLKPGEKEWNMELVEHLFCKEEADIIVQIPLSTSNRPDQLIWKGTSTGFFTVKSAYHLHQELIQDTKGQPSSSHNSKEVWKTLWQLQVTPGEKVFLWRACHNALPTQSNLFKRKIVANPKCPICELEEETVAHALWECESARDVWSQCTKSIQKRHFSHMDFLEIFEAMAEGMTFECMQEFVMVAKQVWWRRNDFIFNQRFRHPNQVTMVANENIRMMKDLEMQKNESSTSINSNSVIWQPPPFLFYKFNWDAAVDKIRAKVGIGIVVRDCEGRIIAIMRRKQSLLPLPALAEAFGALIAVNFALDLGLTKTIFEGDSLQTVQALKQEEDQLSSFGMYVSEAKMKLSNFESWNVTHIKRSGNVMAHVLAQDALVISDVIVTMEDIPLCISDLI
ncbi:hypothetical protein F2P56_015356 [Juglans regia]|uniref:Reverse transcriptase domain-containing protein n=2 Tax=Juglans regia TaxID=51240 RepID=A0A833XEY9_JUGRE|nr:uncharacterized protein LOC108979499 [Juglans regia]KAF5465338.1 hypothetical protein F2P56_015356 [Juglans regia]